MFGPILQLLRIGMRVLAILERVNEQSFRRRTCKGIKRSSGSSRLVRQRGNLRRTTSGDHDMMQEQKIIRAKVGLLELAKQLGNVNQACNMMDPIALKSCTTKAAI